MVQGALMSITLEYEHMTDPDEPCEDVDCPLLQLTILKRKLNDPGYKPDDIIHKAIWGLN